MTSIKITCYVNKLKNIITQVISSTIMKEFLIVQNAQMIVIEYFQMVDAKNVTNLIALNAIFLIIRQNLFVINVTMIII